MKCEPEIDKQLIIAIKNDDYFSYNKLFKRYYKPLCRYVFYIVSDKNDAEDIVQELFLNIWDNRKKINIHENIPAYLAKMAKNITLNHIRKKTTYHANLEILQRDSPVVTEDNLVEYIELQNALNFCIENLSPKAKNIFVLHRMEGFKHTEIAEKMNISVKTIKNQIWISLRKLKSCLEVKGVSI